MLRRSVATLRRCHEDDCGPVAYPCLGLLEHQHRGGGRRRKCDSFSLAQWLPFSFESAPAPGPEPWTRTRQLPEVYDHPHCPLPIPDEIRYPPAELQSWLTLRPGFPLHFFFFIAYLRPTWNLLCCPGCSWLPLVIAVTLALCHFPCF